MNLRINTGLTRHACARGWLHARSSKPVHPMLRPATHIPGKYFINLYLSELQNK